MGLASVSKFYEIGWFTIVPAVVAILTIGYIFRHQLNQLIDGFCEGFKTGHRQARKMSSRQRRLNRQRPLTRPS